MLTTATTERHLREMLEATGAPLAQMTTLQAWEVFKQFAVLPVEDAPDLELFFQWGCYEFPELTEREMFHFDFVRQLSLYEDGEYDRMEQLHCLFLFEPTEELRQHEGNLWHEDDPVAFFATVEQHPVFRLVTARYTPLELRVEQDQV